MAASPPPPPASPGAPLRTVTRRIGMLMAVGCVALFGWYYGRGTWASQTYVDPARPEDGVVCQLVKAEDGQTEIRTATLIPVPIDTAWTLLSNYEEWEKLFKTVRRKQVAAQLDAHRHHVVTDVVTPLGTLSLDFIVHHEELPEGGHRAWWDAPTDELPVNKGTIRVTPQGPNQTLLVYTVRKRYRRYPAFVVNNALLDHQPDLVRTLRDRMVEMAAKE